MRYCHFFLQTSVLQQNRKVFFGQEHQWTGSSVNENLVIIEKTVFFLKIILYDVAYFSFLVLLQKGGVGESPFSVATM